MNRKEMYGKGYTYVVTRRFLDKTTGRMRVRVSAFKGLTTRDLVWTEFRDYDDMHEGDAVFAKHIQKITRLLES